MPIIIGHKEISDSTHKLTRDSYRTNVWKNLIGATLFSYSQALGIDYQVLSVMINIVRNRVEDMMLPKFRPFRERVFNESKIATTWR